MRFHSNMSVSRSGLSYCVSRTLYKIYNKSLKVIVFNSVRTQGMCKSVSRTCVKEVDVSYVENKSKPKKKELLPSKKVLSHVLLRANTNDVHSIPAKYLRKMKHVPDGMFLIGDDSARVLAENILSNNFVENDIPLFETNPGIGLLTKCLLEKGVPKINVFQSVFWDAFHEIAKKYPGKIHMYEYDFHALWRYLLLEVSERNEKANIIMKSIEPKKWSDGPVMKLILTVPNKLFFNQLISSTIFQNGLMFYGRAEFFLLLRPSHIIQLTSGKEAGYNMYRPYSVLFQILFESKVLGKFPRNDFIPLEQVKKSKPLKVNKLSGVDEEYFYLVKVVPRKDLFETVGGGENLKGLWHFVQQCLNRRKNRVIPTLENWVPGCGPRLIVKGMTIFTQFGELSPSEILSLFQDFILWPEYSTSSFLPSMQTALLKKYVDLDQDGGDDHELESVEENLDSQSPVSN